MSATVVTFVGSHHLEPEASMDGLVERNAAAPVTTVLLDTFDGRLHAAGLLAIVEETGAGTTELLVAGDGAVPVRLAVDARPRTAADLPVGPLPERIGRLLDVRVLLPVLEVRSRRRRLAVVDDEGKERVRVDVHVDVAVDVAGDRDDDGDGEHDDAADGAVFFVVHALVGYAADAARVRDALGRHGTRRVDGELPVALAALLDVDLRGISGTPGAELDRRQSALSGFRAVLDDLAATIDANRPGTIDDLDPEFLHDLRVAVRRTRSILGHARHVLPGTVRDRARSEFQELGTITSPARDLDVQVLEWDDLVSTFDAETAAALDPVRDLLVRRRAEAHDVLAAELSGTSCAELLDRWRAWLDEPDVDGGTQADDPLGEVVADRIERTQRRLLRDGRAIDDGSPAAALHELRKDAKKLRYLFECFASILPAAPRKRFVTRLKRLQDVLGEHQDAGVHAAQLASIARELHASGVEAETLVAIGRLVELQERRCTDARARFADTFDEYDSDRTEAALSKVLGKLRR